MERNDNSYFCALPEASFGKPGCESILREHVGVMLVGNLTNSMHPSAREFERGKMLLNVLFGSRTFRAPSGEMLPAIIASALATYPCLVSGGHSLGMRLAQLAVDEIHAADSSIPSDVSGEDTVTRYAERDLFEKAAYRLIAELVPVNKRRLFQELRSAVKLASLGKHRGYSRGFPWMVETYLTELATPFERKLGEFIYDLSALERGELASMIDSLRLSPHAEEFDWSKLEAIKRRLLK